MDVTAATYRIDASKETGAAARKAESRKVREYRSKVDGRHTHLIPAAIELNGRWGEGMVLLFKKVVALATREGRNEGGYFATLWKRRLSIVARTAMITQAHYALRKQDQDDMSDL